MMTQQHAQSTVGAASVAAPPAPPAANLPRTPLLRAILAIAAREVRQNYAYAALAWLLWTAIFIFMFAVLARTDRFDNGLNILDNTGLRICFAIITNALAVWLGMGSTLAERDFDRWAFLIHRPITRTAHFAGRILGGLFLYALIAAVPLAVLLILASTYAGGDFFFAPMILPWLIFLGTGAAWYFAGFLTGDRRALFFGSRGAPVPAAIILSLAPLGLVHFAPAAACIAAVIVLFATAAWGSTLSHGYQLPRAVPLPARWALRLTAGLGFAAVLGSVGAILIGRLVHLQAVVVNEKWSLAINTSQRTHSVTWSVHADGKLVRHDRNFTGHTFTETLTDEAGLPVANPDAATFPAQIRSVLNLYPTGPGSDPPFWNPSDQVHSESVATQPAGAPARFEHWYFLRDRGVAYGYDDRTHQFLGTLSKSGFQPPGAAPTPFSPADTLGDSDDPLLRTDGMFHLNYGSLRVDTLWTPPPGERLMGLARNDPSSTPLPHHVWEATFTDKHVFLTEDHGETTTLPLPRPITDRLAIYPLPAVGQWAIEYEDDRGYSAETDTRRYAQSWYFLDNAGHILRTANSERLFESVTPLADLGPMLRHTSFAIGLVDGLVLPAADAVPVVDQYFRGPQLDEFEADIPAADRASARSSFLIALAAGAIVSALATALLARRYRPRWWPLWILAALPLGLPVPLTLLATHTLPAPRPAPLAPSPTDVFVSNSAGAA